MKRRSPALVAAIDRLVLIEKGLVEIEKAHAIALRELAAAIRAEIRWCP